MAIACANAKPAILPIAPVAYSAPIIAPAPLPFVTATSSQVVSFTSFSKNYIVHSNGYLLYIYTKFVMQVSRNYNAAYAAQPVIAASPYIAAPAAPLTYPSPYVAPHFTSPLLL